MNTELATVVLVRESIKISVMVAIYKFIGQKINLQQFINIKKNNVLLILPQKTFLKCL